MTRKGDVNFIFDKANRLVNVFSNECDITYLYDDHGRRVARVANGDIESYGYLGINELAVFDEKGQIKELRIPGLSCHKDLLRPVAIETKDTIYAPIHDVQNNIVKLIDINTKKVFSFSLSDPFGNNLSHNTPTRWIFSGKPYDKDTNLVYFGHRYYAPELHQWLSIDPAYQTSDLYQYCFNNPFKFFDPDGRTAEKAQEHYDNAKNALMEALGHSMAAGLSIEVPPVAILELYNATRCWIEASKEFNKGDREDEQDITRDREDKQNGEKSK